VHDKSAATKLSIPNDDHLNTSHVSEGATCSRLNVSSSSSRRLLLGKESGTIFGEADNNELHVEDVNKFEDNFVVNDDAFPNVHGDDQDVSESDKEECQADLSVLDLNEKLFKLRSNPFDLEHFLGKRRSKLSYCNSYGRS
jgi:hypothetical protein